MDINIKRLVEEAVIPHYATDGSAAVDLTATSKKVVDEKDYGYIEYGTGLAFEIPSGHVGLLFPRSSVSKTGLILSNAVGVIDSDYRGEVTFRYKHVSNTADYNVGDRIGQLIVLPINKMEFKEVSELTETARAAGGYGSTGK